MKTLRLAVALMIVATLASVDGATAERTPTCGRHGAVTVQRSKYARLLHWHSNVYACLESRGRLLRLGKIPGTGSVSDVEALERPILLAGRYVAYTRLTFGTMSSSVDGFVFDLATLRAARVPLMGSADASLEDLDGYFVTGLEVTGRGQLAWIDRYPTGDGQDISVVLVSDGAGSLRKRQLDIGTGVDPTSLRLNGYQLSWVSNGQTRTATVHKTAATSRFG